MNRHWSWWAWLLGVLTIFCVSVGMEKECQAVEANFTAVPVLPDNQAAETAGYFDLSVKAGEKQTLSIQLSNQSTKEQTLHMEVTNAVTSDVGTIDYTADLDRIGPSLSVPLTSLIKGPKEVKLKAKESQTVEFELSVPKQSFNGVILGGIYFKPKEDDPSNQDAQGVQIQTIYSRLIAVRLQESDKKVTPELQLTDVKPNVIEDGRVFLATIQNTQPVIVEDLSIEANIYTKGEEDTPVYTAKGDGMRMAPDSVFAYRIFIGDQSFDQGSYVLRLTAQSAGKTWHLDKEFKVSRKDAARLNQLVLMDDESAAAKGTFVWWFFGIVGLLLLLGTGVFFAWRKQPKVQSWQRWLQGKLKRRPAHETSKKRRKKKRKPK